ncbi:MAG: endonuclease domain-containing protein [Anaerolineales bacterium]|nr:endonuclease domain-containing protein [Anaerolineales bacterium]
MPVKRTVIGQPVIRVKAERAKQLRTAQTPAEAALWQQLRRSQLEGFHFRRQQVIAGFIVDFYCHSASLIVNGDGSLHAELPEADAEHDTILAARGFTSMHASNADVLEHMDSTLGRIAQACRLGAHQTTAASEPNHSGTPFPFREGAGG